MSNSPSSTRRPKQARAIRTRERILEQAEHAFATKGYDATSLTSDVLEPVGISVGSLYHQFSDKQAVLAAVLAERPAWRDAIARFHTAAEHEASFADAIRSGLLACCDAIDEQPEPWWIHVRELHNADAEIRALVERSWSTWNRAVEAVLRARADAGATSTGRSIFATSGLVGMLRSYLVGDGAARSEVRDTVVGDVAAACVASLVG